MSSMQPVNIEPVHIFLCCYTTTCN